MDGVDDPHHPHHHLHSSAAALHSPSSHLLSLSPSSPSLSAFHRTPSKGRYSPSSGHSAFWVSPLCPTTAPLTVAVSASLPTPSLSPPLPRLSLLDVSLSPSNDSEVFAGYGASEWPLPPSAGHHSTSSSSSSSPHQALPRSLTHRFNSSSLLPPQSLSSSLHAALLSPTLFPHAEEEADDPPL